MEKDNLGTIDLIAGKDYTYDVIFQDGDKITKMGWAKSAQECSEYIAKTNGTDDKIFAEHKGGNVGVYCNTTDYMFPLFSVKNPFYPKLFKKVLESSLDEAFKQLKNYLNEEITSVHKSIEIGKILPSDLPKFMLDNNIPHHAVFYAGVGDDLFITWNSTDKKDIDKEKKAKENSKNVYFYNSVSNILGNNGYYTKKLDEMVISELYYLYINGEFNKLFNIFSKDIVVMPYAFDKLNLK